MADERIPVSGSLLILGQFLLNIALTIKPFSHRWVFYPPIAAIAIYTILNTSTGKPLDNYGLGCAVGGIIFVASDYILLTDVQKELHVVGQKQPAYKLLLIERIKWASLLLISNRGVGWIHEPTRIIPPRPASKSRADFLVAQSFWLAVQWLAFDIANMFNRWNPSFAVGGPPIAASGWFYRSLSVFGYGIPAAMMLGIQHTLFSMACVATGKWEPREFPPLFGSWLNAYTVRRLWGRTWHQMLRRPLTSHAKFLTHRVLGLRHGKQPSSVVQLFVVFLLSGIIHTAADYMMYGGFGESLRFFLSQAVAIILEDAAITLGSKVGIKSNVYWRIIGYVWVWQWLAFCMPAWVDPMAHAGMFQDGVQFSLIEGLWRGDWFPQWPQSA